MSFIALFRGAASKTELSLVDKIELARTYQNITGKHKFKIEMLIEYF